MKPIYYILLGVFLLFIIVMFFSAKGKASVEKPSLLSREEAFQMLSNGAFPKGFWARENFVDALVKFPNLQSCLADDALFDGKQPINWAAIETGEELQFCGYWVADYFRNYRALHKWAEGLNLKAKIRNEYSKGSKDGVVVISVLEIEELKLFKGKFPFFWIKPYGAELMISFDGNGKVDLSSVSTSIL